jgi:hypothetical protein
MGKWKKPKRPSFKKAATAPITLRPKVPKRPTKNAIADAMKKTSPGQINNAIKSKFGGKKKSEGGSSDPAAPAAPAGAPAAEKEFNPYPWDWAKRKETVDAKGNLDDRFKLDVTKERGESPWLKQQFAKQGMEEQQGKDQAVKDSAAERANAQSGLAQTAGASAGAMERMQGASSRDALVNQQKVGMQGAQQRQDLRIGDTERQIGADKTNIGTNLEQIDQTYGADKDLWKTKSAAYGGEQMAKDIEGQKSGDHWQKFFDWRDKNKGLGTIGNMNPANQGAAGGMNPFAGGAGGMNPLAAAGGGGFSPQPNTWMNMQPKNPMGGG